MIAIAKLRPLFTNLNKKWLLYFSSESLLSVDEWMMKYFGPHGLKKHIHGKPIRFGNKIRRFCTSSGYLIQAEPYHGANTGNSVPELGMGGSIIVY